MTAEVHVAEKANLTSKPLTDSNGGYKEWATITEVAECWAAESGTKPEKIRTGLLDRARYKGFEWKLPQYGSKGSLAIKGYTTADYATDGYYKVYAADIDDYIKHTETYLLEKGINSYFYPQSHSDTNYPEALSSFKNIRENLYFNTLETINKEQGKKIFPAYPYENLPAEEPALKEAKSFWNEYNQLPEKLRSDIQNRLYGENILIEPQTINISKEAAADLIRSITATDRTGIRAMLTFAVYKHEFPINFTVGETGLPLKECIEAIYTEFLRNLGLFRAEFSQYLCISRQSFLRWLRRDEIRSELLPDGNPVFWGDILEQQPQSYDEDNIASNYSLWEGIRVLSDSADILHLEGCVREIKKIPIFTQEQDHLNFLRIKEPKTQEERACNKHMEDGIYKPFLEHIARGRIELRGFMDNSLKRKLIPYEVIEGMIDSHTLNFKESRGKSGNTEITGIRVYIIATEKSSEKEFSQWLALRIETLPHGTTLTKDTILEEYKAINLEAKCWTNKSRNFLRVWSQTAPESWQNAGRRKRKH